MMQIQKKEYYRYWWLPAVVLIIFCVVMLFNTALGNAKTKHKITPETMAIDVRHDPVSEPMQLAQHHGDGQYDKKLMPINKIAINDADAETLQTLNGIGEKLALRIINYRKQHGPFLAIEDLSKVKGISAKMAVRLGEYIAVEAP